MAGAVVVAAGRGTRMGLESPKVLLPIAGRPVLRWALEAFESCPQIGQVVLVAAQEEVMAMRQRVRAWGMEKVRSVVSGGQTRTHSVMAGLAALPQDTDVVAIHDGARPCITPEDIARTLEAAKKQGGAAAGFPCRDTLQEVDGQGRVCGTPDRSTHWAVQTPQCFAYRPLRRAYEQALQRGECFTDDVAVARRAGIPVELVDCGPGNLKLTSPEDVALIETRLRQLSGQRQGGGAYTPWRIGTGYDVHRLAEGRPFLLCGVPVDYPKGLLGHSDADVAVHALMDALLGALALPDIGALFPDSDPAYAGADSMGLLGQVMQRVWAAGYTVANCDVTVVCQRPKLAPYKAAMRQRLAEALDVSVQQVGLKATTSEGLGFEGEGLGVSSQAVVLLQRAV